MDKATLQIVLYKLGRLRERLRRSESSDARNMHAGMVGEVIEILTKEQPSVVDRMRQADRAARRKAGTELI